jgi:eukaryotic-like serine/threonine-protein kinase
MGRGETPDTPSEIARTRVGALVKGKWRLDKLIGVGGMAAVYAATHRNGNRVAVKILHPQLSVHAPLRERFVREGYAANAVRHEGVVRVLDDDVAEDGSVFLVMELLEGESLNERWIHAGKNLPSEEVLRITDHLLDILAAAHDRGIVHRDVTPGNVFMTTGGALKVLDFGIARYEDGSGRTATQTGMVFGTPGFMAPEQARGQVDLIDAKTDLWAVGAMMFALISGRLVHQGATLNERMLAAMTQPAPPIATIFPTVDAGVAMIVDKALASDKADRWPDCRAMQRAVREAHHAISTRSPADEIPSLDTVELHGVERSAADLETVRLKTAALPSKTAVLLSLSKTDPIGPLTEIAPGAASPEPVTTASSVVTGKAAALGERRPPALNKGAWIIGGGTLMMALITTLLVLGHNDAGPQAPAGGSASLQATPSRAGSIDPSAGQAGSAEPQPSPPAPPATGEPSSSAQRRADAGPPQKDEAQPAHPRSLGAAPRRPAPPGAPVSPQGSATPKGARVSPYAN